MNRLGLLKPDELSPEQRELHTHFDEHVGDRFGGLFITKTTDEVYVGPFGVLMHHPTLARQVTGLAKALRALPELPGPVREAAVLVVNARTGAAYEWMAHCRISGLPQADLDAIRAGRCPESFDDQSRAAFRLAEQLCEPGPLPDDRWREAVGSLGRPCVTALVHYVGFYKYISTLLNGFDAKLPEEV